MVLLQVLLKVAEVLVVMVAPIVVLHLVEVEVEFHLQ
jgi:hypothetical protein